MNLWQSNWVPLSKTIIFENPKSTHNRFRGKQGRLCRVLIKSLCEFKWGLITYWPNHSVLCVPDRSMTSIIIIFTKLQYELQKVINICWVLMAYRITVSHNRVSLTARKRKTQVQDQYEKSLVETSNDCNKKTPF